MHSLLERYEAKRNAFKPEPEVSGKVNEVNKSMFRFLFDNAID